jgi:hypothetical protein
MASLRRSISVDPQVAQREGLSSRCPNPSLVLVPTARGEVSEIDSSRRSMRTSILRLFFKAPPLACLRMSPVVATLGAWYSKAAIL